MKIERIGLKTLFIAVFSVVIFEILRATIIRVWDVSALAVIGCIRIVEVVTLIVIVFRYEGGSSHIGLDPAGIPRGILKGVLWSLAFGLFVGFCALIFNGFGIDPLRLIKMPLPKSVSDIILFFIVGGIVSPVAEEIFFRGLVFTFFRRWGFLTALILSTAVFALLHPISSGFPLTQVIGGLLFATAFEIEKNLLVPTIIHITGNISIFTLAWLSN